MRNDSHSPAGRIEQGFAGLPEPSAPARTSASAVRTLPWNERARAAMDEGLRCLERNQPFRAFDIFGGPLSLARDDAVAAGDSDALRALAQAHPLFEICMQDPFTQRAYAKPRGYAGDAVMLDYVYSGAVPEGTTAMGEQVFRATTNVPTALSIRFRRAYLAATIDDFATRIEGCRILSVASGHCRELDLSLLSRLAGDSGLRTTLTALDQDPASLETVFRDYRGLPVRTVTGGVGDLIRGTLDLGEFDLIYSAGLFDYLSDAAARALVSRLAKMLRPAGSLIVGNFLPAYSGRGYLEAFMDWRLILRRPEDLGRLFTGLAGSLRTHVDPHGNVAYAQFTKAGEGHAGDA